MALPQQTNTPLSPCEMRRQMRQERRPGARASVWFVGLLFIIVGLVLTLQNTTLLPLFNIWALFFLIPAFACFAAAWRSFSLESEISLGALVPFLMGIVFVAITVVLVLGIAVNWGLVTPLLLIGLGLAILVSAFAKRG